MYVHMYAHTHIQTALHFIYWTEREKVQGVSSLGHILTLNISKIIKNMATHLICSESLQSEVFLLMFNVSTIGYMAHIKLIV